QLRKGAADGPLLKEGMLARSHDDWDPLGDGKRYIRQHGHPVVFGVPRGALIQGKPVPHANVFVAKWRVVARGLDREKKMLLQGPEERALTGLTQAVEWAQFRLNEREDDLEILQPGQVLRQKGFEKGPLFCAADQVKWMNQSFTQAVPFNRDCSEWADCNHFDGGRVAALKYTYNARLGRYEWTAIGPFLFVPGRGLFE